MAYIVEKLKARRRDYYKKELKSLFNEYVKVIGTVYATEEYNKWEKKVIRLVNEIKDKKLLEKYLEMKVEKSKIDSGVYRIIVAAAIAIIMENFIEAIITNLNINNKALVALGLLILVVLTMLILYNYKKNDYTIFYSECLRIVRNLNKT